MYFQESLGEEILKMSTNEIISRTKLLDNEIKVCLIKAAVKVFRMSFV